MNNRVRLALLIVLAAASVGLIRYSCHSVSYASDTGRLSEYRVTLLSLTHEVEHGSKGKLVDLTRQDEEEETADSPSVTPTPEKEPSAVETTEPKPEETPPTRPVSGLKSRNTDGSGLVSGTSSRNTKTGIGQDETPALAKHAVRKPIAKKKPVPKKPAPPKKKPGKKKGKACPT